MCIRDRNNIDLSIRETAYLKNKQAIASRCRELIHNGDSIFLDSSTTTLTIAKAISDMRLTVVTNSLMIINELCDKANIHLIAIGGNYTPREKAFNGLSTQACLETFYLDKTFMSCRSLSMEHGITDSLESVAAVRQSLAQRSKEVYLVADFSKFDKTSFIHITDFDAITGLVTDRKLSSQWVDFLNSHNVAAVSYTHLFLFSSLALNPGDFPLSCDPLPSVFPRPRLFPPHGFQSCSKASTPGGGDC